MTQSNQKPSNKNLKRASVPGAGGSITVEAALSVPIFFLAVICLIYFIEIHNVQTTIRAAAVHAAKICTEDTALVPVLNTSKLESEIVRSIGAKRLENSIVSGGSKGIQCAGSYCNPNGNELNVVVRYGIRLPFLQFANLSAEYKEETINEQISNFAQSYPANSITASIEAPLLINRYRFVSCSCFSCFCKKA